MEQTVVNRRPESLRIARPGAIHALLTRHFHRVETLGIPDSANRTALGADQAMHKRIATFPILAIVLLATSLAHAQKNLSAAEAKDHVGEKATVCGKVVSTRWAESSRGSPTFLNFDRPYPNQVFTLVIWGNDRSKFDNPETTYRGKRVCVTGKISAFKGVPEVVASDPAQIQMQ